MTRTAPYRLGQHDGYRFAGGLVVAKRRAKWSEDEHMAYVKGFVRGMAKREQHDLLKGRKIKGSHSLLK